jgi:Cytochrome c7 and related cytochrome c
MLGTTPASAPLTAWMVRALLLAAVFAAAPAFAQVSPGPLARAHRSLEGNSNCLKCHASNNAGMDDRCLDCHKTIAALEKAGRGFHARVAKGTCAKCHPDHAGVDFALVDWPKNGPVGFDHGKSVGFLLEGKHATVACRDCHQPNHQKVKVAPTSWLGLDPACASCHADPHKGALGADCARCHRPTTWKDVASFDHARTDFPLTGKHAPLACDKCHRPAGATKTILKPIPHAECSSCHKDPHAGRLGPKCSSCHTTTAFAAVTLKAGAFDHDRTRYPLRGAHRALACTTCHTPGRPDRVRPAFAKCADCHADSHAGQGTLAGAPADCAACHDVTGFKTSTFSIARHQTTGFPLDGKHAKADCASCHRPKGPEPSRLGKAGVLMRPRHDACVTCHADPHGGQLAKRADHGACESCHTTAGFTPSKLGVAEHAKLRLPLDGAHARVPCAACHGTARKNLPAPAGAVQAGKAAFVFAGLDPACASCHRDPHAFKDRSCTPCHDATTFKPSLVNEASHAKYAFGLEGAHRALACVECHKELASSGPKRGTLLGAASGQTPLPFHDPRRACSACHTGPHGVQFDARADGGRCDACHTLDSFRPASRFDHDRDSKFMLGRAHAALPCARCHVAPPDPSGAAMVVYAGLDSRCQSCHRPKAAPGGTS